MSGQYIRWCFTLNNYLVDRDYLEVFKNESRVKRVIIGKEKGENNTPHLQGYMEFHRSVRLNVVKRILVRAHWEGSKGSPLQNYEYCSKDGEFNTYGDWSNVLSVRHKSKKLKISCEAVLRGLLSADAENIKNSGAYISRKRQYDERIVELLTLTARIERYDRFKCALLCSWQLRIIRRLFNQNDREIFWVFDVDGGCGKTFLGNYLNAVYNYDLMDGVTSAKDCVFLLSQKFNGIVFDVNRSNSTYFSYSTLESFKNGFVMTGKYQGIKRMFTPVPVIVFANFEPDRSKLSADRWGVVEINVSSENLEKKFQTEDLWPFIPPPKVPTFADEEDATEKVEEVVTVLSD